MIDKAEARAGEVAKAIRVDNLDDPRLHAYRNLRESPRGRNRDDQPFVVEGRWLVQRLLKSDHTVRSVVVQHGREAEIMPQAGFNTDVFSLSRDQIRELAGFDFHRGFLACAERPEVFGMDQLRSDALSLATLDVTDMENLGSMLRSAAAFGIQQILIDQNSVDPLSRRAVRVSMGAALEMRWIHWEAPAVSLQKLHERGFRTVAMVVDESAVSLSDFSKQDHPVIIIVGNEARGLPAEIAQRVTDRVTIAMSGRLRSVDSLNVSVAAAIAMQRISEKQAND